MNKLNNFPYTKRIRWRIRILWLVIVLMLVYMVVVAEIGGGDSRIMTSFATSASRIIFFGGLAYTAYRIYQYKKLLKNRSLLKEQMQLELLKQDERNQYLYDKSGGIVADILLGVLLFITLTASLFNMAAFYTSAIMLAVTVLLKAAAYFVYSRI